MEKWNWYIELNRVQFERLKERLKSRFRFNLNLTKETVKYSPKYKSVMVWLPKGSSNPALLEAISSFIDGFEAGINSLK